MRSRKTLSRLGVRVALLMGCLSLVLPAAGGGQKAEFDYRGDDQRIEARVELSLAAPRHRIETIQVQSLDEVITGQVVQLDEFDLVQSAGDPMLPQRIFDVAVPPNIDWPTLRLVVEQKQETDLAGSYSVPPGPPMRARVGEEELVDWGPGKQIVDGRNVRIYGEDRFYPESPVAILATSQMRKWRFVRIGYFPVQYNPVQGKLRMVGSVRIRLEFERIGSWAFRAAPLLNDPVMDERASERFLNFEEAQEWYQFVPAAAPPEIEDPDYAIITTNAIVANSTKLSSFVTHKTSLGHSVLTVTETDYGSLTGQAPNGTAEKIRRWLIDNYDVRGIHYVLLIGDPDPDDPTNATDSVGDVPMKMFWPRVDAEIWRESPSDYFYADLSGNWNLDGDVYFGEGLDLTATASPDAAVGPDTFSVRWTGRLQVDTAGNHTFRTYSDAGVRLRIDGTLEIDHWGPHLAGASSQTVNLTAGMHDIQIEYREDTGNAVMRLSWQPPGATKFTGIPSSKLYNLSGGSWVAGGLSGQYFNNDNFTAPVLTRVDSGLSFYWGTGDKGIGGVDFEPEVWVGRIPVYNNDYTALDGILQKIIDYETTATTGWRRSLLSANVYLWPNQSDYQLAESLKSNVGDPLGWTTYRIAESDFGLVPPPECTAINPESTASGAPCNMLGEWANGGGYGFVCWSTHGGTTGASHLISSTDASSLDDTVPAFTFHGSCLNGYPESSTNLGYALLANGAIGTVSASRVSWNHVFNSSVDPTPTHGNNANLNYHYAMRVMKGNSAGHALYLTKADVTPGSSWMNKMDYNLYGDPSSRLLRLWGGVVLLFDTSGSMSWTHDGAGTTNPDERRLTLAKEAAYPFLEMLNDFTNARTRFGIARFPEQPWVSSLTCKGETITPLTLVTNASTTTAVNTTIPSLTTDGGTPLIAGMRKAMGMFGTETNRVIVLLSDGYHNCPSEVSVGDASVTSLIDDLEDDLVQVYTIGFGRPADVDHPLLDSLAKKTGGEFYDVTTPSFNAASWDPETELQDTYKSILVDALALQTAADPLGKLQGGKTHSHAVSLNRYDRIASFYLSWATPQKGRLLLRVLASDGQPVTAGTTTADPAVRVHHGRTYSIVTVDRSFLNRPGKVTATPWQLVIDATPLSATEEENYQYSIVLDSRLELETGFDKAAYRTGDTVTLTARLAAGDQPVTGASVRATLEGPADGMGNWYAAHTVSPQELAQVATVVSGEALLDVQRKAIFLNDIRGIASPAMLAPIGHPLLDDGVTPDAVAGDGVYTGSYPAALTTEGTHTFHVRASGAAPGGGRFHREAKTDRYVSVAVSSGHILSTVRFVELDSERQRIYQLTITPKDALGNFLGPRHAGRITLDATEGSFRGTAIADGLDGSYSRNLALPAGVDPDDVDVTVAVDDVRSTFNLGTKLPGRYSLSLRLGRTEPHGVLGLAFDPDYALGLDLEYRLGSHWSVLGVLGYHRFAGRAPTTPDAYLWSLSVEAKRTFGGGDLRPFLEGGVGLYDPDSGSTEPGITLGGGLSYEVSPDWSFEAAVDYHRILVSGADLEFVQPQIRWIWRLGP